MVVNFDTDHFSDKGSKTCKFTQRSEPRSPEVNEGRWIKNSGEN
jgi:hypothetical protein